MRLIAGVIELGQINSLTDEIVAMESNSDEAFQLTRACAHVELIQEFWPLLVGISLPLPRAQTLFVRARNLRANNEMPGSLEEIVDQLINGGSIEELATFLSLAAREFPENPNCATLREWLGQKPAWCEVLNLINRRLDMPDFQYLMAQIGNVNGVWRVTDSWLWHAGDAGPERLRPVADDGDLVKDLASLADEAYSRQGKLYIELLVPEELLHLERGQLTLQRRGGKIMDLERVYPLSLRWSDRMSAPERDLDYRPGQWKKASAEIRERLKRLRRSFWIERNDNLDAFNSQFAKGESGELIGIRLTSCDESRDELIGMICDCGLPFACWPRSNDVDLAKAEDSIANLLIKYDFDELPNVLYELRTQPESPVTDILLLWDDHRRNPYSMQLKG